MVSKWFFCPSGGAEQEVSDAWHLDATVRGNVYLHQRSLSVYEIHAPTGPLHHHPHHLQASDIRGLHDPRFHRCRLGLQVTCDRSRLWLRDILQLSDLRSHWRGNKNAAVLCLLVPDTFGWMLSKQSTQISEKWDYKIMFTVKQL